MSSEHSVRYLESVAQIAATIDGGQIDAMVAGLARCANAAGGCSSSASAAAPGTRRTRSTTSASSADRELRADRQRLRADRAHQRRRLGDVVQRVAARSRASTRDALLVFSVGGGSREHNVSVNLVERDRAAPERRGARSTASSAAAGGTLAELADVAVVIDRPGRAADAARRVLPGRRLARARLAPGAGGAGRATGSRSAGRDRDAAPAAFVDRDGDDQRAGARSGRRAARVAAARRRCRASCPAPPRALRELAAAGWLLVGVSNQPAAAKGTVPLEQLRRGPGARARAARRRRGRLDGFRLCLHHPEGVVPSSPARATAASRRPGCCSAAARELGIDLRALVDGRRHRRRRRWPATAAGCRTVADRAPGQRSQAQRHGAAGCVAPGSRRPRRLHSARRAR